jgi:hypothetical protein
MKKLYFTKAKLKEAKKIWNKRYYLKNRKKLKAQQLEKYHKKKHLENNQRTKDLHLLVL